MKYCLKLCEISKNKSHCSKCKRSVEEIIVYGKLFNLIKTKHPKLLKIKYNPNHPPDLIGKKIYLSKTELILFCDGYKVIYKDDIFQTLSFE